MGHGRGIEQHPVLMVAIAIDLAVDRHVQRDRTGRESLHFSDNSHFGPDYDLTQIEAPRLNRCFLLTLRQSPLPLFLPFAHVRRTINGDWICVGSWPHP